MKSYKSFEKVFIGVSDAASLIIREPNAAHILPFGEDGAYRAYICRGEGVEIGEHYRKVITAHHWIKVYDDEGLTLTLVGETIDIYRAASMGCIIHVY